MFGRVFPDLPHAPCAECGASLTRLEADEHVCDEQRRVDFHVFQLRDEIAAFDTQLANWLTSAPGRFATWIAERDRLSGPDGLAA